MRVSSPVPRDSRTAPHGPASRFLGSAVLSRPAAGVRVGHRPQALAPDHRLYPDSCRRSRGICVDRNADLSGRGKPSHRRPADQSPRAFQGYGG